MIWASVINEFRHRLGLDYLTTPEPVFTAYIETLGHVSIERVERHKADSAEILIIALREHQDHEQSAMVAKAFGVASIGHEMQGYLPAVIAYQSNYAGFVVRLREDDFTIPHLEHALMFLSKLLDLLDEH